MEFEHYKPLSPYTTFGIGGPARYFLEVQSIEQLSKVLAHCTAHHLPYFILGKGSNILFDDRGFDGVVILNKIHFCEEVEGEFYVGAGYSFSLLGTQTARKGWTGLEFASGIPGSVGGAVYMNAGANGGEAFHSLKEVTFVTERGEIEVFAKEKLSWGYRHSCFQDKKGAIAAVRFKLEPSQDARKKQLAIIDYRTKTQPYGEMSAGCIFRNHSQIGAGALIEKSGLKGVAIGGAQVSPLHANFIVNTGSASAQDVLDLAAHIKQVVREKNGLDLEMEVRVIPYESHRV